MGQTREEVFKDFKNKSHAEQGIELLAATHLIATKEFKSFIVGDAGVTMSEFTVGDGMSGGDYLTFAYSAGGWYPIAGKSMTITAGSVLLIR